MTKESERRNRKREEREAGEDRANIGTTHQAKNVTSEISNLHLEIWTAACCSKRKRAETEPNHFKQSIKSKHAKNLHV